MFVAFKRLPPQSLLVAFALTMLAIACTNSSPSPTLMRAELESDPLVLRVLGADGRVLVETVPGEPFLVRTDEVVRSDVLPVIGTTEFDIERGDARPISRLVSQSSTPDGLSARFAGDDGTTLDLSVEATVEGRLTIRLEQVDGPPSNRIRVAFRCSEDDHFWGLGQRLDAVDQRGISHPAVWIEERAYHYMPWIVSSRGFGLLVDETFNGASLDFCAEQTEAYWIEEWADSTVLTLFDGPELETVLERFTSHTGRPQSPIPAMFGNWNDAVMGEDRARQVATTLRTEGIPSTVLWVWDWNGGLDLDESGAYAPSGFSVPDPLLYDTSALADDLHRSGFRFLGYFNPWIPLGDPRFGEGLDRGYYVDDDNGELVVQITLYGEAATVDFTNPDAVVWYQDILGAAESLGFDGWMADFTEWLPYDARLFDGRTGAEVHNEYPLLFQRLQTNFWADRRPDGDYLVFFRAGFVGSQSMGQTQWCGDQPTTHEGLLEAINCGISAAYSGVAHWGSDIAGYLAFLNPISTKELFFRWTTFGAWSPIMRTHAGSKPADMWQFDSDAETLEHYRRQAIAHARLYPYIFSLAKNAHERGVPIIRPLPFEWPGDSRFASIRDQYLFGPSILVAPVHHEGATSREVLLPEGTWYRFAEPGVIEGGGSIEEPAPLTDIPVFVRAGAVVPRLARAPDTFVPSSDPRIDEGVVTLDEVQHELEVDVYLGADGAFELASGTRFELSSSATQLPRSLEIDGAAVEGCSGDQDVDCLLEEAGARVIRLGSRESTSVAGDELRIDVTNPGSADRVVLRVIGDSP